MIFYLILEADAPEARFCLGTMKYPPPHPPYITVLMVLSKVPMYRIRLLWGAEKLAVSLSNKKYLDIDFLSSKDMRCIAPPDQY